jgi:serine/threonine protein kinase
MAANGMLSPPAGPQLAGGRPHPSMPEPLGRVAHYELRRPLGAGGMGEVFLAHDTEFQRPVAIKFLLGASGHDLEARQRLRHEAQAPLASIIPRSARSTRSGRTNWVATSSPCNT